MVGEGVRPRAAAIGGIAATFVMLAFGRWGSHVAVGPIFIGDALLALALVRTMYWAVQPTRPALTGAAERAWPGAIVLLFLAYAALRFAVGASLSLDALRDFAPYGYSLLAFIAAWWYARASRTALDRTMRLLRWALLLHLSWCAVSRVVLGVPELSPLQDQSISVFQIRGDSDGTVLGITSAVFLVGYLKRGRRRDVWIAVASLGVLVSLATRAGFIGGGLALVLALWLYLRSTSGDEAQRTRHIVTVALAPLTVLVALVGFGFTAGGAKLYSTLGIVHGSRAIEVIGANTARARSDTWTVVVNWIAATGHQVFGVGFGPNFMELSGAIFALVGQDDPAIRSPHNYWIGTYARLGAVGVVLFALMLIAVAREIWRVRAYAANDELLLLAAITPFAIVAEATVGVVLESPFGALPFFWVVGILLSRPTPAATRSDVTRKSSSGSEAGGFSCPVDKPELLIT